MSSRREFLKQAAAGAAAFSLTGLTKAGAEPAKPRTIGVDDEVRIGIAGVNSRGKAIAVNVCKMPKVKITCICDCDSIALQNCREAVQKVTGYLPDAEADIRKMVKRKDIDAVMIAMPDHWHATAALLALKAGKHVYLEKPTSYCPKENEMLLKAEKKYKKQVVIIGTQRRSWPKIVEGIMRVREGEIGEVHYAKSWYTAARGPIGKGKVVPVPDNLNWDFWQGPAPRKEYKDNIVHYNWHWFWHWGTGEALNNGTHFVDLVRWGLKLDNEYPTRVTSVGGRYHYVGEDDWETPDTQLITFQYGDKASFSWEGRSCITTPVDGMRNGIAFYGTKGTLYCDGSNSYKITDLKGNVIEEVKSDLVFESDNRRNPSQQLDAFHFQNWLDAIRKGTPVNAPLIQGCISTTMMQLGNIAQRVGRSLNTDPVNGHILGDKEAEKYWGRDYEKGWAPKV
jgi:predicted dehydrogenase